MTCREDIWLALSELWLDTTLDESALRHIATRLRASGLSLDELQHIYCYEVAPQVWHNHWAVAGVWDGFEPQWLFAGCRRNQLGGRWHRLKCRLLRRPMTYGCHTEWQQIVAFMADPNFD
ncbi:DUF7079 family protein [Pseudomonas sp. OTU750018]|uniref:DUF7079 family protein n=1 Tax=Pseudomonas sp. OTU750018 TaxID=2709708 RepID=UPI001F50492A|nr:hypothetical protein [Pseudomonas sp. OTU750018]